MQLKQLGSLLIIFSFVSSAFTYYPLLKLFLFPSVTPGIKSASGLYIEIPKINASSEIIPDIDPNNRPIYEEALNKGVAHAQNTALPGEGFSFVFAHSSLPPWKMTRVNTPFLRLGELEAGDEIIVYKYAKRLSFAVEYIEVVSPHEVDKVYGTQEPYLVLMTCSPVGVSLRRLLVFARQVEMR